jgi:hypothetical protein
LRAERPGLTADTSSFAAKPTQAVAAKNDARDAAPSAANVHDLPRATPRKTEDQVPRSRAERELFDALETLRKGRPT